MEDTMTIGSDPAVVVENLVVRRGKRTVLDAVTMSIPAGRITGLLGPSGCGKTTLMRAIVGTQVVESGTVTVLGKPAGSKALRSKVGYVTQAPSVYRDLSVRDNVAYFAALYGRDSRSVSSAIDSVGLGEHASSPAGNLSGGQLGRVSLASALVAEPEVLVLDEPTVGLDPVLRAELWSRFEDIVGSGATLLVSSHVMEEAEHCSELVLMRDGSVLAQLAPQALLQRTGESSLEHAFLTLIRTTESGVR
ncbi:MULTISPECIES: ABC transporter ATP-binding protein [Nocardiaceae]|jgi:ABC-2 type transport system ATP-binding protein|uniref:ABC transporter ATP-binding protein n=1 Tax=Nocardiaceae TaxID=85025 RepID=UPI0005685D85|nr:MULTISPECIES: ABC transporter ATP-binding protein [Rhodococcus]OZE95763.1 ABC transporter ATP-binding protein [Rhodococcus sp. 15-1189-1-1a]OZF10461.1 ABC transporter ATP-binding protein [Rhodococcus sp. 14-2686-1-2]OZF45694.1 ABC transporter ATP-binding protein [Rhodococcus sp. 14-2470-1b]